jgi:predicted enzyme related to lactoylglutathione lyase
LVITHVFAGIPTADLRSAVPFYERLLGRAPDRLPHEQEAVWQLAGGGLIYVVTDPGRAGAALLTLIVDDLDGYIEGLADRGLPVGPIDTIAGAVRKTTLTDPDGNTITLGQVPG